MATRRLPLVWIVVATALAFVAAGVVVLAMGDDDSGAGDDEASAADVNPDADVPERVQDIVLVSLVDGQPDRTLGELLGERPMVLNFFASWCQPCLEEMPDFEEAYDELRGQVDFVGLAYNDRPEQARAMVERTGVSFPTFADRNGSAVTYFESLGMPTTVFLAADGEVLEVKTGPLSLDGLRDKLQEHFGVDA